MKSECSFVFFTYYTGKNSAFLMPTLLAVSVLFFPISFETDSESVSREQCQKLLPAM